MTFHSEADDRLGLCPTCYAEGELAEFAASRRASHNVGCANYVSCTEHELCWLLGFNIDPSWREEDEGVWTPNAQVLARMTPVMARYLPATEVAMQFAQRIWQTLQ